jgi:hypothetical protein
MYCVNQGARLTIDIGMLPLLVERTAGLHQLYGCHERPHQMALRRDRRFNISYRTAYKDT